MFWIILRSAFRRINKHKGTYFISLLGLTVGLFLTFLVGYIFLYEMSFDTFHTKSSNKFLLEMKISYGSSDVVTPPPAFLYERMKDHTAIVEASRVFIMTQPSVYVYQNALKSKISTKDYIKVDSGFFKLFKLEILAGNLDQMLSNPDYILCSEKIAKSMTEQLALGEQVEIDGRQYIIGGIFRNWPENSSLKFDFVASTVGSNLSTDEKEGLCIIYYEQIQPSESQAVLDFLTHHVKEEFSKNANLGAIALSNQHLDTDLLPNRASKLQLTVFFIVGLIILIVTVSNYSNTALSVSVSQLKTTGMQKILGANEVQIALAYLIESLILVVTSLILSILSIWIFNTELVQLIQLPINLGVVSFKMLLFVSLVAGLCIAIITFIMYVFSKSISAIAMLSINKVPKKAGHRLTSILVIFQCVTTSIFIVLTVTVIYQKQYLEDFDTRFNKDNKLLVRFESGDLRNSTKGNLLSILSHEIEGIGGVKSVSSTSFLTYSSIRNYKPKGTEENIEIHSLDIDSNFVSLFNLTLTRGKNLEQNSRVNQVLINESAYETFSKYTEFQIGDPFPGLENSVVVGSVEDFLFNGFRSKTSPLVLEYNPDGPMGCIISYEGDKAKVLGDIERISKTILPFVKPEILPFEDVYNHKFLPENRLSSLLIVASIISIMISCLGLIGIFQFLSRVRRREMSVRKIFGANATDVALLYSRKYFKILIIALLIGTPIGCLFSFAFLSLFAVQAEIGFFFIVGCVLLQLIIVILVMSFQTIRASISRPIEDLRYD